MPTAVSLPRSEPSASEASIADAMQTAESIRNAVATAIAGKDEIIELSIIALLSGGHLLLEDIPGVGKSTLARALSGSVGGEYRRIQFTSDLLPADVLGVNVWRPQAETFEFREGPLFANFVLADEVNRAPPRTQSALLEAMGERQISVDGVSRPLPEPFMVIATQNPLEHYGTYPLPESQRDRFVLRLSMGYAAADVEASLLAGTRTVAKVSAVSNPADVLAAQRVASATFVHEDLAQYAQQVVQATREHARARLGVSTRGALAWIAAARARALLAGREQINIDDLQELAVPALAHRVLPSLSADDGAQASADELVREIVATVPVPR